MSKHMQMIGKGQGEKGAVLKYQTDTWLRTRIRPASRT